MSATGRSTDHDRTSRFAIGLYKEWHVEEFFVEMSRWVTDHTVIEEFLSVISYQQYVRLYRYPDRGGTRKPRRDRRLPSVID
jgi:hypothetical protein